MSELEVVEKKDVGNAEDILGEIIEQVTAESEISPSDEVEKEAEVEEKWSPLANSNIAGHLETLARNLSKIPKLEFYKNLGKTKYVGWRVKKNRGVVFCYLAVNSTRIGIGKLSYRVKEDGFYLRKDRVAVKAIIAETKKFIKDRKW